MKTNSENHLKIKAWSEPRRGETRHYPGSLAWAKLHMKRQIWPGSGYIVNLDPTLLQFPNYFFN